MVSICIQGSSPKRALQAVQALTQQTAQHLQHLLLTQETVQGECESQEQELETVSADNTKSLLTVPQVPAAAGTCLTPSCPVTPWCPAREGRSGPSSGPSAAAGTLAGSLGSSEVFLPGWGSPRKASVI